MTRLVIGISSSALFDLREGDWVYRNEGVAAYTRYQIEREAVPLAPGSAFHLVRKLLAINALLEQEDRVEVILLSRNTADTGLRVFKSIEHHALPIIRAAFTGGSPPYQYMRPFGCQLFLSTDREDVVEALRIGVAAASIVDSPERLVTNSPEPLDANSPEPSVINSPEPHDANSPEPSVINSPEPHDANSPEPLDINSPEPLVTNSPLFPDIRSEHELRFAFDGDAVLFSDAAERVYQEEGRDEFMHQERTAANEPLPGGPFKPFLAALHSLQQEFEDSNISPIRTALVTARSAPAHERVIKTLRSWDIKLNECLFLGGLKKADFLQAYQADIFFDDQAEHCELASSVATTGHVPHGISNQAPQGPTATKKMCI